MQVTTHSNEIVLLVHAGKIVNVFLPYAESANPGLFSPGTLIRHDFPITVIDLGDDHEKTT